MPTMVREKRHRAEVKLPLPGMVPSRWIDATTEEDGRAARRDDHRLRREHPGAARPVGEVPRAALPRPRDPDPGRRRRLRVPGDRRPARHPARPGQLGTLGGMGKRVDEAQRLRERAMSGEIRPDEMRGIRPGPEQTYMRGAAFGTMDMKERVQLLDREGMAKAVLYPTIGLLW